MRTTPELPAVDVHPCLTAALRTPLAVLRASLESLSHRFEERDPRRPQLEAALSQVTRIQHNLQTVLEGERATPERPLACTLQEIVKSAVQSLVPQQRGRCLAAIEAGDTRLCVDGPLLARTLTRLVEAGLDQCEGSALLRTRRSGPHATFTLLLQRFQASPGSLEALIEELARRDIARLSGQFERRSSREHEAIFEISFPLAVASEEAA